MRFRLVRAGCLRTLLLINKVVFPHKRLDYGPNYGPLHNGVAATRYDENAYLIFEAGSERAGHRLLNSGLIEWDTHFAKPYRP